MNDSVFFFNWRDSLLPTNVGCVYLASDATRDIDGDFLPDEWKFQNFVNLDNDGNGDFDGDGFFDADEYLHGADPKNSDTDFDGIPDLWEVQNKLSPSDPATARLATMLANGSDTPFIWNYLKGSGFKSSLAYPNGLTASWQYDANNQLLQVRNASPTNVISQYDYTYDAAGRRIACGKSGSAFAQNDTLSYGYNEKSELTNAVALVDSDYCYSYDFDDIGNRKTSSECGTNSVYTANNLNQYNAVDDFTPQFDDDGNQTLIKTATGIWPVVYNGENRPILWTCLQSNNQTVSMSYDRMGRRVTKNNQRFVYNGYLCIEKIEDSTSIHYSLSPIHCFVWDPTEPVATRPLVFYNSNAQPQYYTHDGNKNVSDLTDIDKSVSAHYRYEPFGKVATQCDILVPENPFRFSGEYTDSETAMVYYNYRHYEPIVGRWCGRDRIDQAKNLFVMVDNMVSSVADRLGLEFVVVNHEAGISPPKGWVKDATAQTELTKLIDISIIPTSKGCDSGCAKFDVIFPKIKIDVYYKDEYSRVQSYPDEMEHVECYLKWHDKLINIASRAQNKPCMRPIDANAAIDLFVGESDNAAKECDKCNGSLDAKGGSHGH